MTEASDLMRRGSRMGTVMGFLTMFAGMMSMSAPWIAGKFAATLIAILLIGGGIARTIFAFGAPSFGRGLAAFLFGGLTIVAGAVMLANPMFMLASLTLILAFYFFFDGISECIAAFRVKPQQGWVWLLIGGLASVVLGVMIWRQFPSSAMWAIGLLVGIRLMFAGMSMIMLGSVGRAAARNLQAGA